jgi:hypothetical protein
MADFFFSKRFGTGGKWRGGILLVAALRTQHPTGNRRCSVLCSVGNRMAASRIGLPSAVSPEEVPMNAELSVSRHFNSRRVDFSVVELLVVVAPAGFERFGSDLRYCSI